MPALRPPARWILRPGDAAAAARLAAALGLTLPTARVLVARGFTDSAATERWLAAPLDDLAPPAALREMDRAAARLARAVRGGERLIVYGDYDADGVTATAILVRGLRRLGGAVEAFVPRRAVEGYGLHAGAIARLGGPGVLVAVDCGVTALAEVALARQLGLDVIVLDHHEPGPTLPEALAVVDPKRRDQPPVTPYAACGLAFQALRAVAHLLGADPPWDLLDLAAVGTIADVVPLVQDNRLLARHGLARLGTAPTLGLAALLRQAGLSAPVRPREVAFAVAPRLNAAGRLADAAVAVRLLTTEDPEEAAALAAALDAENRRRQELCDRVLAEAVARVEAEGLTDAPALVLAAEGWHPGVVGIVAAHLRERYLRPVVMIAVEEGVGRGSARSVEALSMVEALGACADLLVRYGGHALAAGLTVDAERLPAFRERFLREAGRRLRPEDLLPQLVVDAEVALADVTPQLAREVERLGPFGAGHPEPLFVVRGARPLATRVVGEGHLRLTLTDGRHAVEAIGFARGDVAEVLAFTGTPLDLACTVEVDRWGEEERAALVVRDLATPGLDLEAVLADGRLLVERLFARADDYLGPALRGIEEAGAFYTKVAGVTFEGRQALVAQVRPGEALRLVREPANPHDPHAVAVCREGGERLGYVSAALAARLAPSMDAGARYTATAAQRTGGGDRPFGLNIYIQREDPAPADTPVWKGWAELDERAVLEQLRIHLHGGRPFRDLQRQVLAAALAGRPAVTTLGPGRRGALTAVAAAAALAARQGTPVLLVLPLASQVDAWVERYRPVLREVGLRVDAAHGALPFRARQRLARALARGAAEIVVASAEWVAREVDLSTAGRGVEAAAGRGVEAWERLRPRGVVQVVDDDAAAPLPLPLGATSPPVLTFWCAEAPVPGDPEVALLDDGYRRTNLRLVDRRGADRAALLAALTERGGPTVVAVATPEEAVALAKHLREAGRACAYVHPGLPPRVRRVVAQLFQDGKVTVLVAAELAEGLAPADVRQVVVATLPFTRAGLVEAAALAGLDGSAATVVLAYHPDDAALRRAQLEARFPSRARLAAAYRVLRDLPAPLCWPDEGAAAAFQAAGFDPPAVEAALETLVEAGVVQREVVEGRWRLELGDGTRRDLLTSARHAEGARERRALERLLGEAFGPASALLRRVVGPAPPAVAHS